VSAAAALRVESLAKAYGGTDGHKFVNGVLDKLAPTVREAEIVQGQRDKGTRDQGRGTKA